MENQSEAIRTALERFIAMADLDMLCPDNPAETDWGAVTNALAEARAALAEPLPPKVGHGPAVPEGRELASVAKNFSAPSNEDLLQIAGHAACIDDIQESWEEMLPIELTATEILSICRAVLARYGHQSIPPAEEEVAELVAWLRQEFVRKQQIGNRDHARKSLRAAELLQQQQAEIERLKAQQTPVPASERLPGQKDLSGKRKYCWWWNCNMDSWFFCDASYCSNNVYTHWLPAHALPMPQGGVE